MPTTDLSLGTVGPRAVEIKGFLKRQRFELLTMLEQRSESGCTLARRHSNIADGLLSALFSAALSSTHSKPAVLLAAVGGYGRRQLGLESDLDVRFVTAGDAESVTSLVEAVLYPLWDAGVNIGHQVISVDEMLRSAEGDLPTATALLDFRPVAGDASLGRNLQERAYAELFCEARIGLFLERLQVETEQRHRRFGDSVYLLEPDVKNGAGGLRDADVARWAARASARSETSREWLEAGVLTPHEDRALLEASNFIWTLRNHLHHASGRRNDRLTFDEQEKLADLMGYQTQIRATQVGEAHVAGLAVEALMSEYYRHASSVLRARERIIARAIPKRAGLSATHDLGGGILKVDGQLTVAGIAQLREDPALALRLYAVAVARDTSVLTSARDLIARALADEPGFAAALRASKEAASLFVNLLCTVRSTALRKGSVLAELHDVGLLVAMVPEFSPVVGRVHHDLYHVYTVDVHSVAAVDRLRELMRGDLVNKQPMACRLAAEVSRPEVLFFATLLHDVGKVFGGREHSERGAEMARQILQRFGLSQDDIELTCHLISHHLTMYLVAARRDLSDPATIAAFATQVRERESLRDLYLLTVADISTTAPASMTSWKARMLDELFVATDAHLCTPNVPDQSRLARIREQVTKAWIGDASLDNGFLEGFLRTMPERYLMSNRPEEIVAHAAVALAARATQLHMRLVPSRHPGVAELCVVANGQVEFSVDGAGICVITGDQPGLLAAIAAAVTASRLEIHAAQIYLRAEPDGGAQAVDVFWLRDRSGGAQGVERALPKLERDLINLISGAITPQELVRQQRSSSRWSARPQPPVASEVTVDNLSSSRHTIIEVIAQDRPGLLFTLANALYELQLTIAVAKVNTEGNRVVDVFYVTELDESKIGSRARSESVRLALLRTLHPGDTIAPSVPRALDC